MGATAQEFLQLRAEEVALMYPQNFTKKEAVSTGKKLVTDLLENGSVDKFQVMANISRLKEVINSADSELRANLNLNEKFTAFGVEFNPVNGGSTLNLTEDEIYVRLKADLDARTELLKTAQHQTVIDAYGNDVPKVGTTPRKSSITIKF